jgi:hypothetical protein
MRLKTNLPLVMLTIFLISAFSLYIPKEIRAESACSCTVYVYNKFNLSNDYPNAYLWNDGYLARNGYIQTTAKPGVIVVFEKEFPDVDHVKGHVGILKSITSAGKITLTSANNFIDSHYPNYTDVGCSNVNDVPYVTLVTGRTDVSYWEKADGSTTAVTTGYKPMTNTLYSGQWQVLRPADVDGDGDSDLIAFNSQTAEVRVTRSTGNSFGDWGIRGQETWSPNAAYLRDWVLLDPADVNGDHMADLIAFNMVTKGVDVTLSTGYGFGNGTGMFNGPQVWNTNTNYTPNEWRMLPPNDVTGDGKADLIAFNPGTHGIDVTRSMGDHFGKDGSTGSHEVWTTDSGYGGNWVILGVGKVNSDNRADIIAFDPTRRIVDVTLSITTGNGTYAFDIPRVWNKDTRYAPSDGWKMIYPSDVDGDGTTDIVAFNTNSTAIDATLSNGTNFGGGDSGYIVMREYTGYGGNLGIMTPTDFTSDGAGDLLAFDYSSSGVYVNKSEYNAGFKYAAPQKWNEYTTYIDSDWKMMIPADVNGDGKADIIKYDRATSRVEVMPVEAINGNVFAGVSGWIDVWSPNTNYRGWNVLDPADANGDGKADLIAFDPGTGKIDVTLSTGTGFGNGANEYNGFHVWYENIDYTSGGWRLLPPVDVNNDHRADIILYNNDTTAVDVILSTGTGFGNGINEYSGSQHWSTNTYYRGWTLLNPADVNGDHMADLIAYDPVTRGVDVTLSTGTSFGGNVPSFQNWSSNTYYDSRWQLLTPTDVTGDGKADLIAYDTVTSAVDVTPSTGTNFGGGVAGFQNWNDNTAYKGWTLLAPRDVTGDGRSDLIALDPVTTRIDVTRATVHSTGIDFGNGDLGFVQWAWGSN